jgi:hypothetical protein
LAEPGDEDGSSPLLGLLGTRSSVAEVLLPAMVGCASVGMDFDGRALEFAMAAVVSTAFEGDIVFVSRFDEEDDTLGFEVEEVTLVLFDVMSFPETLDVKLPLTASEVGPAAAVFDETEIELVRKTPEAPEKVSAGEELLIVLLDKLFGPLDISLVVVRM